MFQSQANEYGKTVKIPWRAINQALSTAGAPAVDINSFAKRYDGESPAGALHNIINGNRDSFNNDGIRIVPDTQQLDVVDNQEDDHSEVAKMASHALKSK